MSNPKGRLDVLMDGLGIRLIPTSRRRRKGESHARGAMKLIRAEHGDGHLIFTLRLIRETEGNREELWSETIGAISDVLVSRPDWAERVTDLFEAFDAIDLMGMRLRARRLRPWPLRHTIRSWIYDALEARLDAPAEPDVVSDPPSPVIALAGGEYVIRAASVVLPRGVAA